MKKGWHWPLVIVTFLLGDVVAMGITVAYSVTDSSHHVIPNYYEKAVAHDDAMEQERRRVHLGWSMQVQGIKASDSGTSVVLKITDPKGTPVAGAKGTVEAFHQARANLPFTLPLQELGDGQYHVQIPIRRTGLWVMKTTFQHPDGTFSIELKKDLP